MANDVKDREGIELAAANSRPADSGPPVLSGTWLLVAPDPRQFRDLLAWCARAMTGCGAQVDVMRVDCAVISRDVLGGLLESALAGASLTGVVSLHALNQAPLPDMPTVSAGRAGTLGLVQALGDAGITAPLWVLTGGTAPALGLGRVMAPVHPDGWPGLTDLIDVPREFDERAVVQLCAALAGGPRPARRDVLAPTCAAGKARRRRSWRG
jgi:hypothetical protein